MTPESLLASARSLIAGDPSGAGLLDRCDLSGPSVVDGGSAGDSLSFSVLASNVPCLVETAGPNVQTTVGGETYVTTHKLFLIKSAYSVAVTPKYRIRVYARDDTPEQIYEHTVVVSETFEPLVRVHASAVIQGYS